MKKIKLFLTNNQYRVLYEALMEAEHGYGLMISHKGDIDTYKEFRKKYKDLYALSRSFYRQVEKHIEAETIAKGNMDGK